MSGQAIRVTLYNFGGIKGDERMMKTYHTIIVLGSLFASVLGCSKTNVPTKPPEIPPFKIEPVVPTRRPRPVVKVPKNTPQKPQGNLASEQYKIIVDGETRRVTLPLDLTPLKTVKQLDLGKIDITRSMMEQLSKLSSLETLAISLPVGTRGDGRINPFKTLQPELYPDLRELTSLPNLQRLTLRNDVGNLGAVVAIESLRELTFEGVHPHRVYLEELAGLKELEHLSFDCRALGEDLVFVNERSIGRLASFSKLKRLNLTGCQVSWHELRRLLVDLPQLTALRLDGFYKGDFESENATDFYQVRSLDLSRSEIGDVEMSQIQTFPQLSQLSIANCKRVTDEGLNSLRQLAKLSRLDVSGCPRISDTGIAALQTQLPNCEIVRASK